MSKLEIEIDEVVYEEALKLFKSKENLELYISNALIQYKRLKDLNQNNLILIKELKNVLEFILSDSWTNRDDLVLGNEYTNSSLLINNTRIGVRYTNLNSNKLNNKLYTFTPYLKENNKEITNIIIEVNDSVINQAIVKNINLLHLDRTFKLVYNSFDLDKALDLESVKYQLYLSLSYIFRVDFNEI